MFDFHNHFTEDNAILNSSNLLPEFLNENDKSYKKMKNHIGEFGLDKRFVERISLIDQINYMKEILIYAKEKRIPVSIHYVKYTAEILNVLQEIKPIPLKTLIHNFTGSKEIAAILYKMGVIISIKPGRHAYAKELYDSNPYLVLETDYTGNDKEEYYSILKNHYLLTAEQLGMTVEQLEQHCDRIAELFKN